MPYDCLDSRDNPDFKEWYECMTCGYLKSIPSRDVNDDFFNSKCPKCNDNNWNKLEEEINYEVE